MKKLSMYTVLAMLLAVMIPLGIACAKSKPTTAEPATPSKIERADLLELQVISMQLDDLSRRANEAAKGPLDRRAEILKKYGLDWNKMGGSDAEQFVSADGEIHHKKPASPPDMAAPAPDAGATKQKGKK